MRGLLSNEMTVNTAELSPEATAGFILGFVGASLEVFVF